MGEKKENVVKENEELDKVPISVLNEIEGSMDDHKMNENVEPGSVNRGDVMSEDSDADSIVIHDEEGEEESEVVVVVEEKEEKKESENKLAKYQIKSVPKWFDALSKRALSADLKIECNEC